MTIDLFEAACWTQKPAMPDQQAAWNWLKGQLTEAQLREFAKLYRSGPVPGAWLVSKEQLAQIMLCNVRHLPDGLMSDLDDCLRMFGITDPRSIAYFLGQCGHESAGLRYPLEIASGDAYEGRSDLGNTQPGDGRKFKGAGFLQVTGRWNHQRFADFLASKGKTDPRIMAEGSAYSGDRYPWSMAGYWWHINGMVAFCASWPSVDRVGARVNGTMPPQGAEDRWAFTSRAFYAMGVR